MAPMSSPYKVFTVVIVIGLIVSFVSPRACSFRDRGAGETPNVPPASTVLQEFIDKYRNAIPSEIVIVRVEETRNTKEEGHSLTITGKAPTPQTIAKFMLSLDAYDKGGSVVYLNWSRKIIGGNEFQLSLGDRKQQRRPQNVSKIPPVTYSKRLPPPNLT